MPTLDYYIFPASKNSMATPTLVTPALTVKMVDLYKKTCWPGTDDSTPSRQLIKDIEIFVDELARVYSPVIDVGVTEQRRPEFGLAFVNEVKSQLCVSRPCGKRYSVSGEQKFLPQLYHILGDYGLFKEYMGPTVFAAVGRDTLPLSVAVTRWVNAQAVDIRRNVDGDVDIYGIVKLRIRRIQFLRALNDHCYEVQNPHVHFDNLLERILAKMTELHVTRLGFTPRTRATPSPFETGRQGPDFPQLQRAQSNTTPYQIQGAWGARGIQRSTSDQPELSVQGRQQVGPQLTPLRGGRGRGRGRF